MVSALDAAASGPGSSPGREHCVVLCCVLGHDTLLSQCLAPPRCIKSANYWGKFNKFREVTFDGLASRPGEVEMNSPTQFESARKILPLLALLAKIR